MQTQRQNKILSSHKEPQAGRKHNTRGHTECVNILINSYAFTLTYMYSNAHISAAPHTHVL